MATPYDVSASKFIEKLAKYLKENVDAVTPPAWASIAKTGPHVEKQPQNPDWWYIRCASLLRKIYVHEAIGVERLSTKYGGRKDFGVKPEHAVRAGRAAIRKSIQQLETAGLVETSKPKGRKITREGRKILQEIAESVQKESAKEVTHSAKSSKGG
ncbi:30S ribosomal protein S19e [Candidatus Bathyarchaeota archaeon]|nr:30S ribosomal protein S19e [Candidatus Bathyarchaeota archaeon]